MDIYKEEERKWGRRRPVRKNVLEREVRNLNRNRVTGKITFLGRLDKLFS